MTTDTEETIVKIISIQPETYVDNIWGIKGGGIEFGRKQPYPFHINQDGSVRDQDLWLGDPLGVIGFQINEDVQKVDLWWADAVKDPDAIVGKFPIFRDSDGALYTYVIAIESVTVAEVPA